MLRVYLVCLGPFRTTGSHPLIWLSLTGSPDQRTCLLHNRPLLQQPGKHVSIFISIPSILGKNLNISLDQTPVEGREPAGSFCNLSLTWIQKTKVILSAAETQLPFMLPPGPGAACSPALRPLCPGGGLWPSSLNPSSPVVVPGEAFGLARRTLALSSRAPAALVQRAWLPAQSVQKGRTAPPLPVPASFCWS